MRLIPLPTPRRGTFNPATKTVTLEDGRVLDAAALLHWRLGYHTNAEAEALRSAGVCIQPAGECLGHFRDAALLHAVALPEEES